MPDTNSRTPSLIITKIIIKESIKTILSIIDYSVEYRLQLI
jgi:hypothetical protein